MMLSYLKKKARIVDLDANFVLVKGTNHVGKSCILKSLYRALGAEVKKLPETWSSANISLLLYFTIDGVHFKSLLIGNYIILLNPDGTIRFKEKVGSDTLCQKMSSLLCVNLRVVDEVASNIPIAAIYMPFYIDQDSGWGETWSSFAKVGTLSERSIVRLYMTGIVDELFFTYKKELANVEKKLKKCNNDLHSYTLLSRQARKRFKTLDIGTDVEGFKIRINQYLDKLKKLREKQNEHLRLMQKLYVKKAYVELGVEQLKKNIHEIEKDFQYALELDDVIICPTCGAHYKNDINSRHDLVKDLYACKDLLIRSGMDLDDINNQIKTADEKLYDINSSIESTQAMIKESNEGISIEDVIEAKSREQIIDLMNNQQSDLLKECGKLRNKKEKLESQIKAYEGNGRKEEAEALFVDYVVEATKTMDLSINRDKVRFGCRILATGSALPVNIIAHTFSYLKLMDKYSGPIFMPVVVDEPRQQGLQQQGLSKSISYMLDSIPINGQLIMSLADDEEITIPQGTLTIDLNKTGGVLIEDDYMAVQQEIEEILNKDFNRRWNVNK